MKKINILILLNFIFVFVLGNFTYAFAEDKPKTAVMGLQGRNVSSMGAAVVADFLRDELYNTGKHTVLERADMEKIMDIFLPEKRE